MSTGQKSLETSTDRAAHQCVVGPSVEQLFGKMAYVTMATDDYGTHTWWDYEKRQRDA